MKKKVQGFTVQGSKVSPQAYKRYDMPNSELLACVRIFGML